MLYIRSAAVWFLILLLAILNGGLREAFLFPWFGDPVAHLLSGVLLISGILVASYVLVPRLGARSVLQLIAIGVFWLALTLVFEFSFGRFVQERPWSELLAAYTFRNGNIWPLVLLTALVAPFLVGRRRLPRGQAHSVT